MRLVTAKRINTCSGWCKAAVYIITDRPFFRYSLRLSSRPERREGSCVERLCCAEWRDPEGASSTMLLQGVLPRPPVAFARACATFLLRPHPRSEDDRENPWGELPEVASSGNLSRGPSTSRSSLLWELRSRWRSGRDDRRKGSRPTIGVLSRRDAAMPRLTFNPTTWLQDRVALRLRHDWKKDTFLVA